jgi:hypothetical protein
MNSAGQARAKDECARKKQLVESLRAAMDDIVALSTREIEAAIANNQELVQVISHRLEKARSHKDALLLEFQGHVTSHHC